MSYSWGGGFGGNAVVGVGNDKDKGKDKGNNGVGWGVGGVPPGADNSNKAAPPGQVGKSDAATELATKAATASAASVASTSATSSDSSWGGFRGGSWGASNSDAGFSTGRQGDSGFSSGGRDGGAASSRSGSDLGGGFRSGGGDLGGGGFPAGRGGDGDGGVRSGRGGGSRSASGGGGDRGGRGSAGGGDGGGFSAGRGGGSRSGRGGDGGSASAAAGTGRGGGSSRGGGSGRGGGGGGRSRRLMGGDDSSSSGLATALESWGVEGWGRQLMQIAGVSAGAVATVSGPQASLGGLSSQPNFYPELPPGSDYRSAWADQANSQASGQASLGRKSMALLGGIDYWGLLLLGVSLLLVVLYVLVKVLVVKRRATNRLRMDPCFSGAFRLAAARGDVKTMQAIADGCPGRFHVDADHEGFTALHAAAVEGKVPALLWLCQQGADVSLMKDDGWRDTALHYAGAKGHTHCCQVLLAYGADLHAKNYAGQTPADVAAKCGHNRLAVFLNRLAAGKAPQPSVKTLPATLRRQLSAAMEQYSEALKTQVMTAAAAAGRSAMNKETTSMLAQAVAALGPLNTSGTRSRSVTAASLTDQAAAAVNKVQGKQLSGEGAAAVKADDVAAAAVAAAKALASAAGGRGWEGAGSQGTQLAAGVRVFRVIATITQCAAAGYIVWRALRTLNPGWSYLLSVPIWLCEFAGFMMSNAFIMSLWNQIIRPPRKISDMMDNQDVPAVDVYVPTYSEPVSVLEPTVIAALNMTWPGSRLCVYVLDDGARPEVADMVRRIKFQLMYMGREAELVYVARQKVKGVDHHAKAGNINSALLKEAPGKGTFLLVLDCDMIVHPEFLQNILGHFYKPAGVTGNKLAPAADSKPACWVLKDKAGFIQTPQDFWNVDASDPLVHSARFFYGPMLQGRDGIGACPCCGTGVVFRRDALIAMGGQSYGSITEDYNTAMNMLGAGFATMFLNERLVFGMAPDDLQTALQQRLRWAMGALQILSRTNPLTVPGLTFTQSLLFFEALAHHWLAIATVLLAILPIPFLFTGYSPVVAPAMWEFTLAFGVFYLCNRIMLWWVHRHVEGGSQEMWRGSQMWVWISPNHIRAIWRVLVAENWLLKKIFSFEITFAVTSKDKKDDCCGCGKWDALYNTLGVTWPYMIWLVGFLVGLGYFIIKACFGLYSAWEVVVYLISIMWGTLVLLSIWPPISTLLPREETEEGWKICWDAIIPLPASRAQRAAQRAALHEKSVHPAQLVRQQAGASRADTVVGDSAATAAAQGADDVVPEYDDAHFAAPTGLQRGNSGGNGRGSRWNILSRLSFDVHRDNDQHGDAFSPGQSFQASFERGQSAESLEPPIKSADSSSFSRSFRLRRHADQGAAAQEHPANPTDAVLPFTGVDAIDYQLHQRRAPRDRRSSFDRAHRRSSIEMSRRMSMNVTLPQITEGVVAISAEDAPQPQLRVASVEDVVPDMGPIPEAVDTDTVLHSALYHSAAGPFAAASGLTRTASATLGLEARPAAHHDSLLARASTTLRRRFSMDVRPHHHHTVDQIDFHTTTEVVPFSAAAEAARAAGPTAFGRIGLPGRTRHMMEASSLYTHVILPEPGISVGGARVGGSQRLLAVGADGMLMPLTTGTGTTRTQNTLDDVINESSGSSWISQGESTASDDHVHRSDSSSSKRSSTDSGHFGDGEATVVEVHDQAAAAATTTTVAAAGMVDSEVQSQLQQLAAAVTHITEQSLSKHGRTATVEDVADLVRSNSSTTSATSAGAGFVPMFAGNSRRQSLQLHKAAGGSFTHTLDVANWTALGSVFGGNNTTQSMNYTQMFNTQCAVIPTLPQNIYDHTIAAVPNFNQRETPKSSYMFFIVNFLLLGMLFAASFVEVYVG